MFITHMVIFLHKNYLRSRHASERKNVSLKHLPNMMKNQCEIKIRMW